MKTIKYVMFVTAFTSLFSIACTGNNSQKTAESNNVVESKVVNMEKQEVIQLEKPNLNRQFNVMKAFNERRSSREFSSNELTIADLSDLLWAANGINRPDENKRTAPSAINAQDIDIYVCTKKGAFLYDAKSSTLNPVTDANLFSDIAAAQEYVNEAPICLVLVSDLSRFGERISDRARAELMAAIDAGIVSQNISLFCASSNLVTVPRGYMNAEAIKTGLKLSDNHVVLLNHPIGYKK